jgi:hypothetical protein
MIMPGSIFTPDKKNLLLTEVQDELSKLNAAVRRNHPEDFLSKLRDMQKKLTDILKELTDMKGVVTPQKTDDVLDSVSQSKKTRLEADYVLGMKRSTVIVLLLAGMAIGLYIHMKKGKK